MKTILSILFYFTMAGTTATVGSEMGLKPVKTGTTSIFKAFGVAQKGKAVAITWAAASNGLTHFIIERSADGKTFKPVLSMPYNTSNAFKYMIEDKGQNMQYRIAAVSYGGAVEYSKTKKPKSNR